MRIKSLVEDLPGAGLAGSAAGRHAGAGLELLEGLRAFLDGLRQALFRDAVADADVHGWTLGADPSVVVFLLQIIRIYVFSATGPLGHANFCPIQEGPVASSAPFSASDRAFPGRIPPR